MTSETFAIPPNVRKLLAAEIRKLLGDRRQKDVVNELNALPGGGRWSIYRLSRIVNNEARVQPDEVEDIYFVCGHTDPAKLAKLKAWAKEARMRGHWEQKLRNQHENLMDLVRYEVRAAVQRSWNPLLIPAQCQTEGYATAVILGLDPGVDPDELLRRVAARMERAAVLKGDTPQQLSVLLDERVIRTQIGSVEAWIEQLRHLVDMAEWANVTLQVVPLSRSPHPGLSGWFTLLEFADDIPAIGYTDGPGGSLYLEEPEDVQGCTLMFEDLLGIALDPSRSVRLIKDEIEKLTGMPE